MGGTLESEGGEFIIFRKVPFARFHVPRTCDPKVRSPEFIMQGRHGKLQMQGGHSGGTVVLLHYDNDRGVARV